MAERMMDRDDQIETLARRFTDVSAFRDEDGVWPTLQHYHAVSMATIAIELAEATRDECWALIDRTWPEADDLLDAIADMPLPIADGGGDG